MTVKEQVRSVIDRMPDDCSVEDVQYQLFVVEKVHRGLKSVDEGKGIPHDQVRKQMKSWVAK